ncbi:MAG TPA: hypothetical protein VER35_02995 [Candidatus Limnocylindrales bacterium]|nr:hypothetical protein [Candidatus Limnocylindrales bacterium]
MLPILDSVNDNRPKKDNHPAYVNLKMESLDSAIAHFVRQPKNSLSLPC